MWLSHYPDSGATFQAIQVTTSILPSMISLIRAAVEVPLHLSHRQIIGIFAKRLINLLQLVGVGKEKIWSKTNFCVVGCFNASKQSLEKAYMLNVWVHQKHISLSLSRGWFNSMDHISRSRRKWRTITVGFHHLRMINCNPWGRKQVNVHQGCLETPWLAPARCKRGSKMPGKSLQHNDVMIGVQEKRSIKWNPRECPDDAFFSRKKCRWLAGDFFGERLTTKVAFDVRIPRWPGRGDYGRGYFEVCFISPTISLDTWFQWSNGQSSPVIPASLVLWNLSNNIIYIYYICM